jgi:3-hydroxyisobutyrate dehydrogenase
LPEPADVEAAALGPRGLLAGVKPGDAYFDLSTNSPIDGESGSRRPSRRRARTCSDAPSAAVRAEPRPASWRSGSAATSASSTSTSRCWSAIGDQARYIGPIGMATVAKLVHNMSGYAAVCVFAETFSLGVKAGMDPLDLWEAVRQGAGAGA